jgi:N-acetylglucosaminyl-diphospho-decaprenol L-rhamnosyltransferase
MRLADCAIIIPTFYPGKKIISCLNSLPAECTIIIVDNGDDIELETIIQNHPKKILHCKVGDVGLPKSFNYALNKINKEYFIITQPDVIFSSNCIQNLLLASKKYQNAGAISPLIYENNLYSTSDFMELKFDKITKKLYNLKKIKKISIEPSGDFCVEAINATAVLLKKSLIEKIGGWDENIYTYLEDVDLSLRIRAAGHEIIKVCNTKVDHGGFQSHKKNNFENMNIARNWHFCWSSIYFKYKHATKFNFYKCYSYIFFKYLIKMIVNFLLFRKSKFILYQTRFKACINFLFIRQSNFRPVINKT